MPATIRERLARHRENPSCSSCHAVIDPTRPTTNKNVILGTTIQNVVPILTLQTVNAISTKDRVSATATAKQTVIAQSAIDEDRCEVSVAAVYAVIPSATKCHFDTKDAQCRRVGIRQPNLIEALSTRNTLYSVK